MWAVFKDRYKAEAGIKNIAYESQKAMIKELISCTIWP